jgi:hypothetical protein
MPLGDGCTPWRVQRVLGKRGCCYTVTPHICIGVLPPGGSLVLARCRVVAGAAGLDSTRSSACRTEVKVMLTGAERSRMDRNARGADTPGAFCCLA